MVHYISNISFSGPSYCTLILSLLDSTEGVSYYALTLSLRESLVIGPLTRIALFQASRELFL